MWTDYVDNHGIENLRKFKYNGVCDSILYKHVLSPWAQFIVDQLPMWLAPNVITLTGFAFLLVGFLSAIYYNPYFDTDIPNWLCVYIGVSIFIYQTLDNCDGKQARRTQSSSALGMLLDHGTDCLVQLLIGVEILMATRIAPGDLSFFAFLLVAKISFYFGVYQQFYTGQFRLDVINGVDEGLPVIQLIFIFTGFVGPSWWLGTIYGIPYHMFLVSLLIFGAIQTSLSFSLPVFGQMNWNPIRILHSLKLPICISLTYYCIARFSPTNTIEKYELLYIAILGFQWCKMINLWQLSIITKQEFSQIQLSWILIQGVIVFNLLTSLIFRTCLFDEVYLGLLLLVYSFLSYGHCVISLVLQLCWQAITFGTKFVIISSLICYVADDLLNDLLFDFFEDIPLKVIQEYEFQRILFSQFLHGYIYNVIISIVGFYYSAILFEKTYGTIPFFYDIFLKNILIQITFIGLCYSISFYDKSVLEYSSFGFWNLTMVYMINTALLNAENTLYIALPFGFFIVMNVLEPYRIDLIASIIVALIENSCFGGFLMKPSKKVINYLEESILFRNYQCRQDFITCDQVNHTFIFKEYEIETKTQSEAPESELPVA